MKYSHFACGLTRSNIGLDRKILADLAKYEPYSFKAVVDEVKVQFEYYQQKRKYTVE
jgi:large subunit ribosomal protein L20